ncbi:hypothetical protein Purlil1_9319 [Purpureocillium lilacinum]|uniref:Uncharacterized protein n=1 Tax=Purpureocillium lilacinum TaxID=33203 RepID=A0ABR0BQA7_PURLI|nr:hypothetical protein Purlil1_9319 [Purpureocillium lilacinum]
MNVQEDDTDFKQSVVVRMNESRSEEDSSQSPLNVDNVRSRQNHHHHIQQVGNFGGVVATEPGNCPLAGAPLSHSDLHGGGGESRQAQVVAVASFDI